jgi:hypothetical protein
MYHVMIHFTSTGEVQPIVQRWVLRSLKSPLCNAWRPSGERYMTDEIEDLIKAGKLKEAGRKVGEQIPARIARNRAPPRGCAARFTRKTERIFAYDAYEFFRVGGMWSVEHRAALVAAREAVKNAVQFEREYYLPRIEAWLAAERDEMLRHFLTSELNRLRRALGLKQSDEERRAKTRARVARHRAKKARQKP